LQGKSLIFRGEAGIANFHGRDYARTLMCGPALIFSKAYSGGFRRAKGFRFAQVQAAARRCAVGWIGGPLQLERPRGLLSIDSHIRLDGNRKTPSKFRELNSYKWIADLFGWKPTLPMICY
jgi:hypothetical protein